MLDVGTDQWLAFLHRWWIPWRLSQQNKGDTLKWKANIFIQKGEGVPSESVKTIRQYGATSTKSAGDAPLGALVQFLRSETCDYHDYHGKPDTMTEDED